MKIGVLDYGLNNVGSLYSAFNFYNYDVSLVNQPDKLKEADLIVLGGVGNFKTAVSRLKELRLWDALNEEVIIKKKRILGICLGMQLFADVSYEDAKTPGLGWIKGKVVKIEGDSVRVPHMGWNEIKPVKGALWKGIHYNFFYFMHSYHLIPENKDIVLATTSCGEMCIASAIMQDNILGVQFHPEKSQGDGLRFLRNFVEALS